VASENTDQQCEIGVVGLGVMGRNILLNMADHGFAVSGYDNNVEQVAILDAQSHSNIQATNNLKKFIESIRKPRAIMLLVPAGEVVDLIINELLPYLEPNDIIIDAGNSFFKDTQKRALFLNSKNINFLGVGVSGGESGARHGPSIMPGGPKEAYERVRPIFEAIAAKVNQAPCVAYLGPNPSGHYVKMVHNGIEYGLMQLIAETYDLMRRGLKFNNEQLQTVYSDWNKGELNSYLLEITSQIFTKKDHSKDDYLIDVILDVARQKGTGLWTTQSAMELQVPIPTIDAAVSMRDLSGYKSQRQELHDIYPRLISHYQGDEAQFLIDLKYALYLSMIIVFAQGMSLLQKASQTYGYDLNLESVTKIWRGGCIIRAALLEEIKKAFQDNPNLKSILTDLKFSELINRHQANFRHLIGIASELGIAVPGMMASLSYFDALRSAWLPTSLIQAQRDYFGSHTYERVDESGSHHTQWEEK
jgi:6-phosphogluconate dehydrogenase